MQGNCSGALAGEPVAPQLHPQPLSRPLTRCTLLLLPPPRIPLVLSRPAGAYIPAYLARRDRLAGGTGRSFTYVLGNMLSAGVMVSAGFCHLLGEALKQMPHMQVGGRVLRCS
jgi:hypothetical protein